MLNQLILIGLGGALGAVSRFHISGKLNSKADFPIGTLLVNLAGSFSLGFLWGWLEGEPFYLFAGIGFLGALTTYSTLHVELQRLSKRKGLWLIYLVSSYLGGFLLAYAGYLLA